MTSQQLDKRLSCIAAKVPEKPNQESEAAFKAIICYLDELAARKAAGCLSPLELCQYILAKGVRKHGSKALF